MTEYNYKKGDVVYVDHTRCPDWAMYKTGTINKDDPTNKKPTTSSGAGYGSDPGPVDGAYPPVWAIRLDGYDYGTNDGNHHFISEMAIYSTSDEDVEEAIASILKGPAT